jgi:alpha-aminoadipate carrier protein LysW
MGKKVICPECAAEFEATDDVMLREVITCPDCGLDLDVTEIHEDHVKVEKITLEREDWGE